MGITTGSDLPMCAGADGSAQGAKAIAVGAVGSKSVKAVFQYCRGNTVHQEQSGEESWWLAQRDGVFSCLQEGKCSAL